ncbi:MAG TPA: biotin/lipoyl-binding protein, partial [Rubrivivax sp.]|nr:biotin/lipoyl-binding protein [Rubrivivax sp.]
RRQDGARTLSIGEQHWPFEAQRRDDGRHDVRLGERRLVLSVYRDAERWAVFGAAGSAHVTEVDALALAGEHVADAGSLTAPMPGKVVSLLVAAGERVRRGQPLVVIEAMKMEHTLHAPSDGAVEALLYAVGDPVAEGDELLRLAQAAKS